jgi:uncharacterized membrane protein
MTRNSIIQKMHHMPAHARLWIGLSAALITFILSGSSIPAVRFVLTWISFSASVLLVLWATIITAEPNEVRQIAKKQDSSRPIIFLFVIVASVASMFAVIILLKDLPHSKPEAHTFHITFTIISVTLSWILIHSIFTFRYAHLFYACRTSEKGIQKELEGGLQFPNDDPPDYLDFAYFSFVIGMTFQVSDIQITSRYMRRLVLLHGLLSFVYSTVIVALSINIISGLIEK